MSIIMFDSATNSEFPGNAQAVAGYVDGGIQDQPNFQWLVNNFTHAYHLSIALNPAHDAYCLDIENGAATPQSAAAWYARQKARGIPRPCLYASASVMESDILPILKEAGFPRGEVRLWSAHYGQGQHICGPHSCGLMSVNADGTQWTSTALGRNLDQSILNDDFFSPPWPVFPGDTGPAVLTLQQRINAWHIGPALVPDGDWGPKTSIAVTMAQQLLGLPVAPVVDEVLWQDLAVQPPSDPTYGPPTNLRARGGHTSVLLSWKPPGTEGLPVPAEYIVEIYDETTGKMVSSYPRKVVATSFQGGSLEQGKAFIAHVVASGPHGTQIRPHTYASVKFETA